MIRKVLVLSSVCLLLVLARPQAQGGNTVNVDDVVAKSLEARGGLAAIQAVQTMKWTARFNSQGMDMPMTLYAKRPNLTRKELTVGGQTIVFVFDGTNAWQINPLQGSTAPVDVTGPELAMIRQESDFDPPFVDYKTRGYTLTYAGLETIDGRQLHHLRVARGGATQDVYIDAATGLEARTVNQSPMGLLAQEFLDYRTVQGLRMPYAIRTLQNNTRVAEIKIDAIELNAAVDDRLFRKP
jgi:outer membrane lipoprotein-sorting protein